MVRAEALAFAAGVNKKLKDPTALVLASDLAPPPRFTSGSLAVDVALGGGWPGNQWSEIIGEFSAGKTMLALKTIAANQAVSPDFTTFWLSAEKFDTSYADLVGVNRSLIHVAPTQDMELALELILEATQSRAYDCIVCDSFPALIPEEEDDKAMNEASMTLGARIFGKFWRKMGKAAKRDPFGGDQPFLGLMINQWRDKIGPAFGYVKPRTSPGGHAKDYAYYTRVDVKRVEYLTEKWPQYQKPVKVGQKVAVTTIKNKSAAPQQTAEVDFYFRDSLSGMKKGGYDLTPQYFTLGVALGVIRKSGGWYYFGDEKWQGEPALTEALRSEPVLAGEVAEQVLAIAQDPDRAYSLLPEDIEAAKESGTRRVKRRGES